MDAELLVQGDVVPGKIGDIDSFLTQEKVIVN